MLFTWRRLTLNRHFFPSTEIEAVKEDEWVEIEGDKSAENGAAESPTIASKAEAKPSSSKVGEKNDTAKVETEVSKSGVQLPDVPTGEPVEDGPATKKHKSDGGLS